MSDVDRSQGELAGGGPVTEGHRELKPNGQQKGYVVLTEAERAKGFVQPVRRSYIHKNCGGLTTMAIEIAETYAGDPGFYSGTFCVHCREHRPVAEFVWDGTDHVVGSLAPPSRALWRERSWCVHETVVGDRCAADDDKRFLALALFGAAGEFANLVKKEWRAEWGESPGNLIDPLIDELADVTIYHWLLCRVYGLDRLSRSDMRDPVVVADGAIVLRRQTARLGSESGVLVDICGESFDVAPMCEECGAELEDRGIGPALNAIAETIDVLWANLAARLLPSESISGRALRELACSHKETIVAQRYAPDVQAARAALDAKYSHPDGGAAA